MKSSISTIIKGLTLAAAVAVVPASFAADGVLAKGSEQLQVAVAGSAASAAGIIGTGRGAEGIIGTGRGAEGIIGTGRAGF